MIYSFLDTNMLLHYPLPDQVDWPDLMKSKEVTIVLAPVVFRELNRHKDKPDSRRLRDRAATVLRWFDTFVDDPTRLLRESVSLLLLPADPTIDFAANRLSRDLNDDWLLASILEFQAEFPQKKTVFVTEDRGLKVKAIGHGLNVARLPETLRLPDEPDEIEKNLRHAEDELRRLRNAVPDLKLAFADGNQHTRVVVDPLEELTDQQITGIMANVRNKHPKKSYGGGQSGTFLNPFAETFASALDGGYNSKLEAFYSEYGEYLAEVVEYADKVKRTFKVQLILTNTGKCPATKVHVFLHFPDGIAIYDEDSFDETFIEPTEPRPPVEGFNASIAGAASPLSFVSPQMPAIHSPFANVTGWTVKRSNSVDVSSEVKELTHGLDVDLEIFHVMFESRETVRSFQIDFELLAGNIPEKLTGKLHVIVESSPRESPAG
jgi:hypothetical protein